MEKGLEVMVDFLEDEAVIVDLAQDEADEENGVEDVPV